MLGCCYGHVLQPCATELGHCYSALGPPPSPPLPAVPGMQNLHSLSPSPPPPLTLMTSAWMQELSLQCLVLLLLLLQSLSPPPPHPVAPCRSWVSAASMQTRSSGPRLRTSLAGSRTCWWRERASSDPGPGGGLRGPQGLGTGPGGGLRGLQELGPGPDGGLRGHQELGPGLVVA